MRNYDVIVAGAGNAALCAALAAREGGASVLVLEWAPESQRGGNSAFTGGTMRVPYSSAEDLRNLTDLTAEEEERSEFGSYAAEEFYEDVARLTDYRADPDLLDMLVRESMPTLRWMRSKGVRFVPAYGRQSFDVKGKQKFWGGLAVEVAGGGIGLVDALTAAAENADIDIRYRHRAVSLVRDRDGAVRGVRARTPEGEAEWTAGAVVLATGGFQANAEWRARYLGPPWDLARVRGTRFDMGDGIRMALDAGAMPWGHWSGCHAVGWDLNAPLFGDRNVGDGFSKHFYQFGILINSDGGRFVDEGADYRSFTYAKYGGEVLRQKGQFAWQVFDRKVQDLLRPEFYTGRHVSKVEADSLEALASKLEGVDAHRFLETVAEFNRSVNTSIPFDPSVKDGRCTTGIYPPKSNWANTFDVPPFRAFPVTAGITFTFGGVHTNAEGRVLDMNDMPIPGLLAAGEMVAGLFYGNYPGSTGLSWGSVLGRRAGYAAAKEKV